MWEVHLKLPSHVLHYHVPMPAQLPLLRKLSLHFYSQVHVMTPNIDRYTVFMNKMYSCSLRVALDNSLLLTKSVCFHSNFGFLCKNNIVWWLKSLLLSPSQGAGGGRMYMFPWSLNLFLIYPLFPIKKTTCSKVQRLEEQLHKHLTALLIFEDHCLGGITALVTIFAVCSLCWVLLWLPILPI